MTAIPLAGADRASQAFQHSLTVSGALEDIVTRLEQAIAATDLWVLHEIDPQALLARDGFVIEAARQVLFFHPRLMARLLAADSAALLEAPLKFALTQASDGRVMIRWSDPIANFVRYGDPQLTQLGRELAELNDRIVTRLIDQSIVGTRTAKPLKSKMKS